ncbi:Crp/Fnr family transcriptional regulator [Tenacibaculum sp. TC6]|uniref:Crp/Fnr family transcriptional regulator n=1 Tax=Tenacibaculum sp. TC6 TaxID=3423223 RepID=UPI003D36A49C
MEEYLASFNLLTAQEIRHFSSLTSYKKFNKGDYFIKEGAICNDVAFVTSGIFRSFYHSTAGEEVTYCFLSENSFVTAYSSFISQTPTTENIEAIVATETFIISKEHILQLEQSSNNWLKLFKLMAEQEYINLEKRIFVLQRESAENRYKSLLQTHPHYLNSIPLSYIASYLGITQRHLSRIRKTVFY